MNARNEEQQQQIQLAQGLLEQQSLAGTIVGSLIAAIPAAATYIVIFSLPAILYVSLVVPGVIIGLGARFMGRGLSLKHNLIAALVALATVIAVGWYLKMSALWFFASFVNVPAAGILASRNLDRDQRKAMAIYEYKR